MNLDGLSQKNAAFATQRCSLIQTSKYFGNCTEHIRSQPLRSATCQLPWNFWISWTHIYYRQASAHSRQVSSNPGCAQKQIHWNPTKYSAPWGLSSKQCQASWKIETCTARYSETLYLFSSALWVACFFDCLYVNPIVIFIPIWFCLFIFFFFFPFFISPDFGVTEDFLLSFFFVWILMIWAFWTWNDWKVDRVAGFNSSQCLLKNILKNVKSWLTNQLDRR